MSKNYIVINGKKAELTREQLEALGIVEKEKNPFDRAPLSEYFFIDVHGQVHRHYDKKFPYEEGTYDNVNYFTDETFANQVALHQLLYRKLLKFAYDNGYEDTMEWDGCVGHWTIYYSPDVRKYDVAGFAAHKFACVWFSCAEGAERAIKEVVEPFMKEYPDFVW